MNMLESCPPSSLSPVILVNIPWTQRDAPMNLIRRKIFRASIPLSEDTDSDSSQVVTSDPLLCQLLPFPGVCEAPTVPHITPQSSVSGPPPPDNTDIEPLPAVPVSAPALTRPAQFLSPLLASLSQSPVTRLSPPLSPPPQLRRSVLMTSRLDWSPSRTALVTRRR